MPELQDQVTAINSAISRVSSLYIKWTQKHNINFYTFKILYALKDLKEEAPITQKQISEALAIPKQTVNSIVTSLKQDGYISLIPSEGDKREKKVALTEKGRHYALEILEPLLIIENNVVQRMNEKVDCLIESATAFGDFFELEMSKEDRPRY